VKLEMNFEVPKLEVLNLRKISLYGYQKVHADVVYSMVS